jgi:putative membrane protein
LSKNTAAKLAGTKEVTLLKKMSKREQEAPDKVAKLSRPDFGEAYLEMEISHHSKDLSEFQKEAKDGKDPHVKAWAAKTVAVIEEHLEMARGLSK